MSCGEVKLKISEYIDGELLEEEKKAILEHIKECEDCRKLFNTYKSLSQNIKDDIPQIPEDFKVILPKKRKNIFSIIRGHEGLVSAVAAAAALMIFAGGVEKDVYKAPVAESNLAKEPQVASRALPSDDVMAVAESGISGFIMPPKEEFENEEIYESLLEKLEILRERELNGEDIRIEFEQFLTEVENSKG